MWCYRRMLRISWTEKVSNEEVLERAKIKKRLYNIIQTKKLQYFRHIIRQNGDTLHRTVLDVKVNGSRGRGRPRTKWTTNITKWTGLEYHQAVRQAQHRQEWRTIASNPWQEDGTWWWYALSGNFSQEMSLNIVCTLKLAFLSIKTSHCNFVFILFWFRFKCKTKLYFYIFVNTCSLGWSKKASKFSDFFFWIIIRNVLKLACVK